MKILPFLLFIGLSITIAFSQSMPIELCPTPDSISMDTSTYVEISKVSISCPDTSSISWAKDHLNLWYGNYAPEVVECKLSSQKYPEGAYSLIVNDDGVTIESSSLQGIRYGLYSLRQLAIAKRGTLKVEGWIAPKTTIKDSPTMNFRGIHICWFPETKPFEIERFIRIAAYYKMNYAVIESWGNFRSESTPWYGWPDGAMTKGEIHRLCSIAKDLGITLIPELNIFGHATLSRVSSGKHAALDYNPEYQPLFEPLAGWNWCLTNPETKKVLGALIEELLEAFENPPYFHIGCDEATPPSCPDCMKRPYSELFIEHVTYMQKLISSHGAKTMMWHDMLLDKKDDKWNGFVHNGTAASAKSLNQLSHDIIICDWYYDEAKDDYPTLKHFKDAGFDVITCPWINHSGTVSLSKQVDKLSLYGMLGTLWHKYYGPHMYDLICTCANAEWNSYRSSRGIETYTFYNHLRQVGWDMNIKEYEKTGIYHHQIPNSTWNLD